MNRRALHKFPEIIAHRGASSTAPENTLAAFDLAWRQEADAIECDIHLSRDGHCVVSHDDSLARTSGSDLKISQSTLADLKKLDVGRWKGGSWAGQAVPSLEEVLAKVPPGKRILIEVKSGPKTVPALKNDMSNSHLALQQAAVISFDADVISAVKLAMPRVEAYLLSCLERGSTAGKWTPGNDDLLAMARACNADGLDLSAGAGVNEELAGMMRAAGLKIFVWTVDAPEEMRRFIDLGVDGITTDCPDLARRQILDRDRPVKRRDTV